MTIKRRKRMERCKRKKWSKPAVLAMTVMLVLAMLAGCSKGGEAPASEGSGEDHSGEVYILYTSDIHCGVSEGFGLAGLYQIRKNLEDQGYTVLLVDNGDSDQGEALGTMTKGEAIIDLMTEMKYDVAIPGNHDFDYGIDRFLELAEKYKFPYISCNFNKNGKLVFQPYVIKEAAGKKIAFVGVTTPQTMTAEADIFGIQKGDDIYGFMQDESGEALYAAVQKAVDDARAEGADYVYVLGHLGMMSASDPWTYDDVISNVSGIDVFLDGHSHDTEQVVMKDKDGKDVVRSACGTKLQAIGYSLISAEEGIKDTNIWTWNNKLSMPELVGIENDITKQIDKANDQLKDALSEVLGKTDVDLTVNDPVEKDSSGAPLRMIRRAETNMGDFIADSFRIGSGADVALVNGGAVRDSIDKGEITYGELLEVQPFNNELCVVEATGQQIADALEWGAKDIPSEFGGFLQVSGMTYEIDVNVPSTVIIDADDNFAGVSGERRVRNITIGGEPIDLSGTYTVAGCDYLLLDGGDGNVVFKDCKVIQDKTVLDNQLHINYIEQTLGGEVGSDYADPHGQGRITIIQ